MTGQTAAQIIGALGLQPHPEGGHYAETYRDAGENGGRGACTVIHYLLQSSEKSHWHRVDACEIWAWHAGSPLRLGLALSDGRCQDIIMGGDLTQGQQVHAVVPAHAWQAAESLGDWTLVSCVVAPAFHFAGFDIAPPGWEPEQQEGEHP